MAQFAADAPVGGTYMPIRFLKGCGMDPQEALRRWETTRNWRREEKVEDILHERQEKFAFIKRHYPHGVHRSARNGMFVYIERPTKANTEKLWGGSAAAAAPVTAEGGEQAASGGGWGAAWSSMLGYSTPTETPPAEATAAKTAAATAAGEEGAGAGEGDGDDDEAGCEMAELLRHYVYITEFIWRVLDVSPEGRLVTIIDVDGVGMYDLVGYALQFIQQASVIIQAHYVERSEKIFVVNVPSWFSMIWSVVTPFIHENTLKKVSILGADFKDALNEYIDDENLPEFLGGTDPTPFGESPQEIALREHTNAVLRGERPPIGLSETDPNSADIEAAKAAQPPLMGVDASEADNSKTGDDGFQLETL